MGIRDGGHLLSMPVKQEAHIELFDGTPIYSTERGRDITRSQLITMPERELSRLGHVLDADDRKGRLEAYDAGYFDAHLGLMLPARNDQFVERTHNVITQLGLNGLADKIIAGSDITLPTGMEVGGSSTTASTGDTDVITQISDSADSFQAWSSGYPSRSTATATWRSFWDAGEAQVAALNEVVMKSSTSSTDAISRITFTTIDKSGASDTLQITINWAMTEA